MVSDRPKRKAIPARVKDTIEARQRGLCACGCGELIGHYYWGARYATRYDHRPPLALRSVNADKTDFEPPQHSVCHIDALTPDCHDKRTFEGRSGATSLGSDAHAIAKLRRQTKPRKKRGPAMKSRPFQKKPVGHKHKWPTRKMVRAGYYPP